MRWRGSPPPCCPSDICLYPSFCGCITCDFFTDVKDQSGIPSSNLLQVYKNDTTIQRPHFSSIFPKQAQHNTLNKRGTPWMIRLSNRETKTGDLFSVGIKLVDTFILWYFPLRPLLVSGARGVLDSSESATLAQELEPYLRWARPTCLCARRGVQIYNFFAIFVSSFINYNLTSLEGNRDLCLS